MAASTTILVATILYMARDNSSSFFSEDGNQSRDCPSCRFLGVVRGTFLRESGVEEEEEEEEEDEEEEEEDEEEEEEEGEEEEEEGGEEEEEVEEEEEEEEEEEDDEDEDEDEEENSRDYRAGSILET